MKFCIATIEYWESHGFDVSKWRKSIDGTKTLVHMEFAKTLIPAIETDQNVQIYVCPSAELDAVLDSPEWTISETI